MNQHILTANTHSMIEFADELKYLIRCKELLSELVCMIGKDGQTVERFIPQMQKIAPRAFNLVMTGEESDNW